MNADPWGTGYKIVTRTLGIHNQETPTNTTVIKNIVNTLFPGHPKRAAPPTTDGPHDVSLFTERELSSAASAMDERKLPGPVGLPAKLMKTIAKSHPKLLLDMYNPCLKEGIFAR